MTDRCRKCGERPRSGSHRWCTACIEQSRRTPRANAGKRPANAPNAAAHAEAQRPGRDAHTACRQRIADLEAEVAHLKRQLAERQGRTCDSGPEIAEMVRRTCVHGGVLGRCRKLGCGPAH